MNPDVVAAIGRLRETGVLADPEAAPLLRVARRELVSVHAELQTALYIGVLLATSGVGLFLKENHERLGPAVIASLLGGAALLCLAYVARRAPPFSWQSQASPHVAVDYVLLLGVLLLGADLAYVEAQFRLLGPLWPEHLLLVSLVYLVAAYRFDSRVVLGLALSSFAAWRGVAVSLGTVAGMDRALPAVRWNALACGAAFVAAGALSALRKRKPHFEPTWGTLGLLLVFGGLLSGVFTEADSDWILWTIALAVVSAICIGVAYRLHRTLYLAIGILAAYLGLMRLLAEVIRGSALFFVVAVSSIGVVALLVRLEHRRRAGE